jgi:hypothetical protein
VQLPPLFNLPKSQLQCYGESVYCTASDMLSICNRGQSPLDRFIYVVAWSISTTRPVSFGVAPYNPILGETHHVSKGNLNVLLEQVFVSQLNSKFSYLYLTMWLRSTNTNVRYDTDTFIHTGNNLRK